MLLSGLILLMIGMLTVFVFLIIMVIVMNITANVIKAIGNVFPEVEETTLNPIANAVETHEDIAIVLAVVEQYTKN